MASAAGNFSSLAEEAFAADQMIEGATLLDIAPTVLTLLGLPVGEDMQGKVLVNAFVEPPTIERVPSWEEIEGKDGRLSTDGAAEDPAAAQAALQQLVELGYVAPPGDDALRAIALTEAESDFNTAVSLGEGGRFREAKEILTALAQRLPDEPRYWQALAQTCFAAQTPEDAAPCVAALERFETRSPADSGPPGDAGVGEGRFASVQRGVHRGGENRAGGSDYAGVSRAPLFASTTLGGSGTRLSPDLGD